MRLTYEALPAIYDIVPDEREWTPTLDAVASAAGGVGALLFGVHEADEPYSVNKSSSNADYSDEIFAEFMQRFGHYDAHGRAFMFSQPPLRPFTDHDIWPGEDLFNREDFRFTREKGGIFLRGSVNISPDHGWHAGLIVHFADTHRRIDRSALDAIAFLAPHLSRSLELRRFVFELHRRYQLVLSVLDRMHVGLAVANLRGEVVVTNAAASVLLEENGALWLSRNKRMAVRDETAQRALDAALSAAASTAHHIDNGGTRTLHVPRRDREPLFVEISPMRDSQGEVETGFAGALLTLIDPESPPRLSSSGLAILCGFTAAERQVAELLLTGLSQEAVAERRGVAFSTVRSQTKAILAKARVQGRGALIRKAAHLSPPVS